MAAPVTAALPVPVEPPPRDGVLRYLGFDGCVRLPITVDAAVLTAELGRLPADAWGQADRDPVVLASVESFFAMGYPRGLRPPPSADRPVLAHLPALRRVLCETFAASPTRAMVARLLPQGLIPIHSDTPRYFRGTVRLSIQVVAGGVQRLFCDGLWYGMAPGEVWALDNLRPHAIHNSGVQPRVNVLVDYPPSNELVRQIAAGEPDLGVTDEPARQAIEAMSRERYRKYRWRAVRYELFKLLRRRGR